MCADLILLANGAAGDKVVDEDGKSWPPEVALDDSLGAEPSEMARGRGGMDGVQERGTSGRRYIHTTLVVEVSVIKGPVGEGRPGKKGCFIGQVLDSTKDERVGGGR